MIDATLLRDVRYLVIDMDGVLYRGSQAIAGTAEFIQFLRELGIRFVLATNNSTRTPQLFADKLAAMGVEVDVHEILTSSQATAGYLASIAPPDAKVFTVGMEGLQQALTEAGFELVEDGADYVVAGMDFTICYERLMQATLQIRAGAEFIGTNPDLTFPTERGIVPGAGSLLAFLTAATGVTPTVIGKPETAMIEMALERLGGKPQTTAMLGDRLETDILAGKRAGLATLLVLSGVTDVATLERSELRPDLVFAHIAHLHAVWREVVGEGEPVW